MNAHPDVAVGNLPMPYFCADCSVGAVKLWRPYQTFLHHVRLLCRICSEREQADSIKSLGRRYRDGGDQIGWRVPAVPTNDGTFWGYASTPLGSWSWWADLPESDSRKGGAA